MEVHITHIDTACILLELDGFKILTDPTLDNAGGYYHHGFGAISRKTASPALESVDLSNIDLVLLSHHQHKDNLDKRGREVASTAAMVISTPQAAKAMNGVIGLDDWQSHEVKTKKISNLKVTATPAQHHPWWMPRFFSGNAIGFIIECDGLTSGAIYISGDTVFFDGIAEIGRHFNNIGLGIFHVGSAEF